MSKEREVFQEGDPFEMWYRPHWMESGARLLEELTVVRVTQSCLFVALQSWNNGPRFVRRQDKAGAKPSKLEALNGMLVAAKRSEQNARDSVSRAVQRRIVIENAISGVEP